MTAWIHVLFKGIESNIVFTSFDAQIVTNFSSGSPFKLDPMSSG